MCGLKEKEREREWNRTGSKTVSIGDRDAFLGNDFSCCSVQWRKKKMGIEGRNNKNKNQPFSPSQKRYGFRYQLVVSFLSLFFFVGVLYNFSSIPRTRRWRWWHGGVLCMYG